MKDAILPNEEKLGAKRRIKIYPGGQQKCTISTSLIEWSGSLVYLPLISIMYNRGLS